MHYVTSKIRQGVRMRNCNFIQRARNTNRSFWPKRIYIYIYICPSKCSFTSIRSTQYHLIIFIISLQWRHNDHDGVSNHQPHGCLLNCLFRRRSKKTSKLRVTGLCVGNHRDRWIPRTKGQLRGKCFHLITSSCTLLICFIPFHKFP